MVRPTRTCTNVLRLSRARGHRLQVRRGAPRDAHSGNVSSRKPRSDVWNTNALRCRPFVPFFRLDHFRRYFGLHHGARQMLVGHRRERQFMVSRSLGARDSHPLRRLSILPSVPVYIPPRRRSTRSSVGEPSSTSLALVVPHGAFVPSRRHHSSYNL